MDHSKHSQNEIEAFAKQINVFLANVEILRDSYLPLNIENFFHRLRDGVIIGHLIDLCFSGMIEPKKLTYRLDLGQINTQNSKVLYEVNANLDYVIECAKATHRLVIVNVGPADILNCNEDIVLGIVWQLLSYKISSGINIQCCPALVKLAKEGESLLDIANMKKEALLVRWINYHLEKSGCRKLLRAFGKELNDCVFYAYLLGSIFPAEKDSVEKILNFSCTSKEEQERRAELLLDIANRQNIKLSTIPADIISGSSRLHFSFAASIFNHDAGIYFPSEAEIQNYQLEVRQLRRELNDLQIASELSNYENKEKIDLLEAKIVCLIKQNSEAEVAHKSYVASLESKYEENKQELAQQYRESMLESIRIKEQDYENKVAVYETEISEINTQLRQVIQDIKNITNLSEQDMSAYETSALILELNQCIQTLRTQNIEIKSHIAKLECELDKKESLNSLMGSKIKEYAEQAIQNRKSVGRRSSLITKMFSGMSNQ